MTAATAQPKAKQQSSRIARLILPQIDANSALLPPDKWILRTSYEFVKDNKSFHKTIGRAAAYAGGGLVSLIAGAVGAVLLFPLALPMAAAGLAAIGAAVFAGFRAKHHVEKFKEETLPELRTEVGKKYLDYKMKELKAAWQRNLDERRKKNADTKKAKNADAKPAVTAPEAKTPEPAKPEVKAETVQQPAVATEKKSATSEKKTLGGAFAELARKMAEERARKLKEQDAKKDAPKADAPKPADPKPPTP